MGSGGISEWVGGGKSGWGMAICGGGLRLSVCVWLEGGRVGWILTGGWGWTGGSGIGGSNNT